MKVLLTSSCEMRIGWETSMEEDRRSPTHILSDSAINYSLIFLHFHLYQNTIQQPDVYQRFGDLVEWEGAYIEWFLNR